MWYYNQVISFKGWCLLFGVEETSPSCFFNCLFLQSEFPTLSLLTTFFLPALVVQLLEGKQDPHYCCTLPYMRGRKEIAAPSQRRGEQWESAWGFPHLVVGLGTKLGGQVVNLMLLWRQWSNLLSCSGSHAAAAELPWSTGTSGKALKQQFRALCLSIWIKNFYTHDGINLSPKCDLLCVFLLYLNLLL